MTNTAKTITLLSIATTLILGSCSSKFGSREEAKNAADDYKQKESKEVVVVFKATFEEIMEEKKKRQELLKRRCRNERKQMLAKEPVKPKIFQSRRHKLIYERQLTSYIWSAGSRTFVEQNCSPIQRVEMSEKDIEELTRRNTWNTISCNEERETNQFVCKEIRVNRETIDGDEWKSLKPNYSYFRY